VRRLTSRSAVATPGTRSQLASSRCTKTCSPRRADHRSGSRPRRPHRQGDLLVTADRVKQVRRGTICSAAWRVIGESDTSCSRLVLRAKQPLNRPGASQSAGSATRPALADRAFRARRAVVSRSRLRAVRSMRSTLPASASRPTSPCSRAARGMPRRERGAIPTSANPVGSSSVRFGMGVGGGGGR
jgi:hypothetical protein